VTRIKRKNVYYIYTSTHTIPTDFTNFLVISDFKSLLLLCFYVRQQVLL